MLCLCASARAATLVLASARKACCDCHRTSSLIIFLQVDVQEDMDADEASSSMSAGERAALLNQLPANLGSAARAAVDKANGSELQVCHQAQYHQFHARAACMHARLAQVSTIVLVAVTDQMLHTVFCVRNPVISVIAWLHAA